MEEDRDRRGDQGAAQFRPGSNTGISYELRASILSL